MRAIATLVAVGALSLLGACAGGGNGTSGISSGGGSSSGTNSSSTLPQNAEISGAWQAVATSVTPGAPTVYVEANLTQQSTSITSTALLVINSCIQANSSSTVMGTVSGQSVSLDAIYNGETVLLNGTVAANGTISGSYSASGVCGSDSGTWTAQQIAAMSGSYTGNLIDSAKTQSTPISVAISNSAFTITGTITVSSGCFANLRLDGSQVGGAATVTSSDGFGNFVKFVFVTNDATFSSVTGVYQVISMLCTGNSGTVVMAR